MRDAIGHDGTQARDLLQRGQQPLHPHGLDEIINGVHLEVRERMLVERRREDDHGWMRQLEQVPRELDAVHVGHVDVGEHELGRRGLQQIQRLAPVLCLADDGDGQRSGAVVEELAQPAAGGSLVVDDEYAKRHFRHGTPPDGAAPAGSWRRGNSADCYRHDGRPA